MGYVALLTTQVGLFRYWTKENADLVNGSGNGGPFATGVFFLL